MDAGDTYLLIILLILLLFSSFFSSTETALMSVNKIKLRSLADGGNKRAALALDITENHTAKMLSAILIGNNIVNVSASSLATTLAYSFGGQHCYTDSDSGNPCIWRDYTEELCDDQR